MILESWFGPKALGNELFLGEFPEKDPNPEAIDLGQPLTNGPLKTVQVEENGVFGPPGQYPTHREVIDSSFWTGTAVLLVTTEKCAALAGTTSQTGTLEKLPVTEAAAMIT